MANLESVDEFGVGAPVASALAGARLGLGEKVAYTLGATGTSLAWNLATGFLVFYYSDIAGIPLPIVGSLMLATRVLDAIFDPIAGVAVDHTKSRWGKARPYLLFVPLGFAVLLALTFSVPTGTVGMKTLYACATFTILGLFYSFFYVPFGALLPAMVRTQSDKVTLASLRSIGIAVGSIVIYAATLPLVRALGQGVQSRGFTAVAALAGLICVVGTLSVFLFCRERSRPAAPEAVAADRPASRWNWTGNPIWRIEMIFSFLMFVRLGITVSDTAYYAKAVTHDVNITSYMLPLSALAPLLAGMAAPWYLRQLGVRRANVLILGLSALLYLTFPFLRTWMAGYLVVYFLVHISIGINTASLFVIFADACDLQEHRDGTRREGVLGSTSSFSSKVGMAVGSAILAFSLSLAGYQPKNPVGAAYMVDLMFWLAPAVICVVQALIMLRFRTADEVIAAPVRA